MHGVAQGKGDMCDVIDVWCDKWTKSPTYALCSSTVSELWTLLLHSVLASFFIVLSRDPHLLKGALREGRGGEGK